MTSAARREREMRRLVRASERHHKAYWRTVVRAARIRALLFELDAEIEMATVDAELAALDGAS